MSDQNSSSTVHSSWLVRRCADGCGFDAAPGDIYCRPYRDAELERAYNAKSDRTALRAERDRLVDRVAEIDALLNQPMPAGITKL